MSTAIETVRALSDFAGRGAGTDAERRAALWVAETLRARGRPTTIETFWCRPNWALAQSWHVGLGIAGSLVAVGTPRAGVVMLLVALLSLLADAVYGISPGRRLSPERASQNVVSAPPAESGGPTRLILTANLDTGRQTLVHRRALRRPLAPLRRLSGGRAPGWLGWLALLLAWTLATALVRLNGSHGTAVAVAQLIPTIGLVLVLGLLLELASASWSPAAGDNASGVAVALALARALDAAPPAHASVELALTGAGDHQGIGLRRHLRARRATHRAANTVVIGFGPCSTGHPVWLESDGVLAPLAFSPILRRLSRGVAELDPDLKLTPARQRGVSPALPARAAGLPAITLQTLDPNANVPRSHPAADTTQAIDQDALDRVLRAALLLVDAIDGHLG